MDNCKNCGKNFNASKSGNMYYCARIEYKNFLGFWMTDILRGKVFCSNKCLAEYVDSYGLKDGERAKQG
jgi:hypothetical protein